MSDRMNGNIDRVWDGFYNDEHVRGGICGAMEKPGLIVKSIAWVVTFAFLWQIGLPLAEAASNGTLIDPPAKVVNPYAATSTTAKAPVKTEEDEFAETVDEVEAKIASITAKLAKGEDESVEEEDLAKLEKKIRNLSAAVNKNFDAVRADLVAKKLPAEILARHDAMVKQYKVELTTLLNNIKALGTAATPAGKKAAAEKAKAHLESKKHKRKSDFDPNDLPTRIHDGKKTRKPIETEKGYKVSGLFEPKGIAVAAIGSIVLPPDAGTAPTAEDLAATTDVQITQPIRDLAASLGNDPVKIYNWVHDNIQFLPTYGSIQGSDMTLLTKKGNSFDTSSLLIALLRAAGIHSRYGYGTVQIPIDKVMNWVGGVSDPSAAVNLLLQGGVPAVALTSGGVIKAVKMEQVWVEAWVDYFPSRAARHKEGDSWIPMDASFKQYTYTQGIDLQTAVPFDAYAFTQQITVGAQIDPALGSVTGIDTYAMQTSMDDYQLQLLNYINTTDPYATVGDVLGAQSIVPSPLPHLASSLPYKILARGSTFSALPASLRSTFSLTLYATMMDKAMGTPSMTYSSSLPELAGKRLTYTYEPATAADQAVIQNAIDSYATTLPAHLIHVMPVLKVDGATVATGPSVQLGEDGDMILAFNHPLYSTSKNCPIGMGDLADISLNLIGVNAEMFQQRVSDHDLSAGNETDFTAEMFHQLGMAYWGELNAYEELLAKMKGVKQYRLPSHGLAKAPLSVTYFFGLPRFATYKSRMFDIKSNWKIASHVNNDAEQLRQYQLQTGIISSYLESSVMDQMFLNAPGTSMSTIEGLNLANRQGIPIHRIDSFNSAAILPQISLNGDELADIQAALAAGKVVTVPAQRASHNGWNGTGYIIEDPVTGSGAFKISGGWNGSDSPAPESVYPLPQIPANPILLMLMEVAISNVAVGASLVARNGVFMGIAMPAPLPRPGHPGILLASIIVSLMFISSQQSSLDRAYPRVYRILRHYTRLNAYDLIMASKWIKSSDGGDLFPDKKGVFFADAFDAPNPSIQCPPTASDSVLISGKYELPLGIGEPAENRARAYVEIELTRMIFPLEEKVNGQGQREVFIIVPAGLYFGPYANAVGIKEVQACP